MPLLLYYSVGVLPQPPKTPITSQQANMYASTSQIDNPIPWDEALSWFKEDLHKSLEESLGVHLKSAEGTYSKPYPLYFDYMKAPDGCKVPDFISLAVKIIKLKWITLAYFLQNWVKLLP